MLIREIVEPNRTVYHGTCRAVILERMNGPKEVPAPPGETPIPAGMVRRFHYTPRQNIPSIREHGLLMQYSHGRENREPVAIWSNPDFPTTPAPVVEFWDEPEHYERHPYARLGDIGPERIIAIHEPWHQSYRYVKQEGIPLDRLRQLSTTVMTDGSGMTYGELADIMAQEQGENGSI